MVVAAEQRQHAKPAGRWIGCSSATHKGHAHRPVSAKCVTQAASILPPAHRSRMGSRRAMWQTKSSGSSCQAPAASALRVAARICRDMGAGLQNKGCGGGKLGRHEADSAIQWLVCGGDSGRPATAAARRRRRPAAQQPPPAAPATAGAACLGQPLAGTAEVQRAGEQPEARV